MEVKKLYGKIIKDDTRYDYTQKFLEDKGIKFGDENSNLNFILFPFKEKIDNTFDEKFFSNLSKDVLIFSGIENSYLKSVCKKNNLKYEALMNSDYISILNAIPTAEGIISYLIQNRKTTIANSNILIIGYGRCGKVLADKLLALGAKVFVNTLNKSDYAIAISHKIIPNPQIDFSQKNFDVIINTAPAQTISNEDFKLLPNETLLIDITSVGFDIDIARKKNVKSARFLSIPAKFALQTAGEILGEYIYKKVLKCSQKKKSDSV